LCLFAPVQDHIEALIHPSAPHDALTAALIGIRVKSSA
jgi:hypothetical protein